MINKHPSFKDLKIRIPIIIPIKARGFINKGSTLQVEVLPSSVDVEALERKAENLAEEREVTDFKAFGGFRGSLGVPLE